jgi:uncharacterized membrane protein YphA (DoxX/SURF4 family)
VFFVIFVVIFKMRIGQRPRIWMVLMAEEPHIRKWLTNPNTGLVVRTMLACVFIYASLDKINRPDLFAEAVYNYRLLPDAAVNLVAVWLPWLELGSGVLLLLGMWVRGSILVVNCLMAVFVAALGINVARGLDISCGCFTVESTNPLTILTLFRDSLFLLVALYLFWFYQIRGVEMRLSLLQILRRT